MIFVQLNQDGLESTGKRSILHCGREDFRDVFREDFREDFKKAVELRPCRVRRRACAQCAPARSSSSGGSRSASASPPPTAAPSPRTSGSESNMVNRSLSVYLTVNHS